MPSNILSFQQSVSPETQHYLPLDSLRDYAYCPRLFGLIYIEGLKNPNSALTSPVSMKSIFTDNTGFAVELPVSSKTLELVGVAPRVEFYPDDRGIKLDDRVGRWMPAAAFTRAGPQKAEPFERINLCAVTICLEELYGVNIDYAVFYQTPAYRRELIKIDSALRENTIRLSRELRSVRQGQKTASFCYASKAKCFRCPMKELCLPELNSSPHVHDYLKSAVSHFKG